MFSFNGFNISGFELSFLDALWCRVKDVDLLFSFTYQWIFCFNSAMLNMLFLIPKLCETMAGGGGGRVVEH